MVILNRFYTRTGDDGTTALGSGERRPKYDLRVSAYGTVDETNATIGVARLHACRRTNDRRYAQVAFKNDLFDLGADLAVPQRDGKAERLRMLASQVGRVEQDIDTLNADLAPLNSFVLPGGTPAAAQLHLARTVSQSGTPGGGTGIPAGRAGERCRGPISQQIIGLFVCCEPRRE